MCIDFGKLNKATRKVHYPLPFIGIPASPRFTLTPWIKRRPPLCVLMVLMLIGVCLLVCVMPLLLFRGVCLLYFMVFCEEIVEVFMDDFSVYGNSFDHCLHNLNKVLQRCEKKLVLNWEKCHFMVSEGIVLGHKISERGIEVDKAKIEAIKRMPYPRDIKGIRNFLGHAGFYRKFIKDFSKTSRPLTILLQKDAPFVFDEDCKEAFEVLKKALITAPIVQTT